MAEQLRETQTDQLHLVESSILGHLPGFEAGTTRALVSGVEAAAIALKVTTGLHNFRVDSPNYYLKWADHSERKFTSRYFKER